MAKKITIQHLYTTGSTAPAASALTLGEIAIATSAGTEAIFIKNSTGGTVDFPTRKQIVDYVDLKTKGIATSGEIETLDNKISGHITGLSSTDDFGHVKLVGGDLDWATGNTITSGEAAASYHTHGQYLEESLLDRNRGFQFIPATNVTPKSYGVKAGTGITVDVNGVSIDAENQGKIASGVTAFNWGNHAEEGYAKNSDLNALSGTVSNNLTATTKAITDAKDEAKKYASGYTDTEIEKVTNRITPLETSAETWNETTAKFNAFYSGAVTGGTDVIDTLVEIQNFLSGDTTGVKAILDTVDNLTTKVENNTTAITANASDITNLKQYFEPDGTVPTLQRDVLNKVDTIDVVDNLSATTNNIGKTKTCKITHTTAGAQTSAITATNDTTGLSFGSEFEIVNKVGYDKNGHVVSGSTQTLKLPSLTNATSEKMGVVKLIGDINSNGVELGDPQTPITPNAAVGMNHTHKQYAKTTDLNSYVKLTDLYSGNTSNDTIIISCGTY